MPGPGARDRSKQSRKMKSFERDGESPDDRMAKVRADEEAKATAGKRVTQADMDAERAQADAATARSTMPQVAALIWPRQTSASAWSSSKHRPPTTVSRTSKR